MADLSVTIGLDQTELEKGLANAGKTLGELSGSAAAGENPFSDAAGQLSSAQGIGNLIAGPMGALAGAFVDSFGGMIGDVMGKIKELADYAQTLRRMSIATGVSISELNRMESFGQAFGVSLDTIVSSFTEFTRRMGEVRIKGGELTNVLAKMGVGMDEVANGTFNHQKAMKMLADAYAAGTDEATLLYYGTKMFGDAFKDMLPIIQSGSKAVEDASDTYLKLRDEAGEALGRFGQDLYKVWEILRNAFVNILGTFVEEIENLQSDVKNILSKGFFNPFESDEAKAKRVLENTPKYMTDEERIRFVLERYYDEDERDAARKELEKQLKGGGKILSPFGMSEAGAASQMQQMGGGDIFGAVAFTPLERIATATEETATNTRPKDAPAPRTPDELSR
jgi:hypothetical protein